MRENLFKIIGNGVRLMLIALWLLACDSILKTSYAGYGLFEYWILSGLPFGIRKMSLFLVPRNFDIGGTFGVLALNVIIGGLIGGFVIIFTVMKLVGEMIAAILGSMFAKFA